MSKYLRVFLLAMLAVVLIASVAMAGTTRVNNGGINGAAPNIAWEAMSTSRAVNISGSAVNNLASGANTVPVSYQYTQQLLQNTQYVLKVDLNGATFNGNATYNVCAVNTAGITPAHQVAQATPGAISTYNFNINTGVHNYGPGGYFALTNGGCENGVVGGAGGSLNVAFVLSPTSSAGSATITMELLQGGSSIDAASTATLATIVNEYVPTTNSSTHTIDYLGTPGNGTRVINNAGVANITADGLAAGVRNTFNIGRNVLTFSTVGTYNLNTNNTTVSLTDTANWQGISKVYVMKGQEEASCASANATSGAINTSPSGTVTLRVGGAGNFSGNQAGGNMWFACLEANGTTPLQPRTIRGSITVATSGQSQPASPWGNIMIFNTNAYQGIIPWAVSASHVKTYCLVNNTGNAAANVIFDLLSKEGAAGTIANQSVTSVPAGTSKLIIFDDGKITDEQGTTLVTLTGLSTNNRYSARITVTTGGNQANMTCIQTDPVTQAKRAVPVLTNFNNTNWQQ